MDDFFVDIGRAVLARWKKANFSLSGFPEIARAILEEHPPAQHADLAALMREFLLVDEQPFQTQSGFGQPELVVFDDPRFYIQVLFWLEGTTDIHQHEFSGAFHVMQGSSIHAEFDFENARDVSAHFRMGELRMKSIELLETGTTMPITSGPAHVHSLFHLDMPSVSVVIRTHNDPGTGPQFTYLPPHVALDPANNDALTMRRKQLLDVLEQTGDPNYLALVREMLGDLDFERGFFILQNGMGHLRRLGEWEETIELFQQKHGALANGVAETMEEIVRRDRLVNLRASVTGPEHRFFLALLLNVPDREGILRMVAQRFERDPVEAIIRWAEELGESSEISTWILDAEFPEELAIPPEQQAEVFLDALRGILKGYKKAKGPLSLPAADLKILRATMAGSSLRPLVL